MSIGNKIADFLGFPHVENPHVADTFFNRYLVSVCKKRGCIEYGTYYIGMPQAWCRRCGHKTRHAADYVSEWVEIDTRYL